MSDTIHNNGASRRVSEQETQTTEQLHQAQSMHDEPRTKRSMDIHDLFATGNLAGTHGAVMALHTSTRNGAYEIHDFVPVEENPVFVVERKTNTRIYPPENYPVSLTIHSRDGFKGIVTETLRADFSLGDDHNRLVNPGEYGQVERKDAQPIPTVQYDGDKLLLIWEGIEVGAGESATLEYEFNAPDISPELFVVGPTVLTDTDDNEVFAHSRPHQLAMDDLPPADPVGHWKFDENTGTTANDFSGLGNSLTLSSASWTPQGMKGSAWNGTGAVWVSRTDDDDFDFTETDSFAISLWFKSDSAANPASQEWILNKSLSGGTQQAGYAAYAKTDGTVCFGWDDDTTWDPDAEICTSGDVYDANWHHLLATKNVATGTVSLFLDSQFVGSVVANTITAADSTGNVGQYGTSIVISTDDYPVIAYRDETNQSLKVLKCGNASCTFGNTTATVDATDNVGRWSSLVVGNDGFPVISYYDITNEDLSGGSCGADGLSLDGIDDYASVSDPADGGLDFVDGGDFTLTGWFYRETSTTDDVILAKRTSDAGSHAGYLLYVDDATDRLDFAVADGTDEYAMSSSTIFVGAGWHHFAVVWDDDDESGSRIYIDGNDDRATHSGIIGDIGDLANAVALEIGRTPSAGGLTDRFFDGNLMGIKLYRYALSEQLVRNDRNNGAANFR